MGEHNVQALDERQRKTFTRALLNDVRALERLLETGRIEQGIRRIGAEQEMFLVDPSKRTSVARALEKLEGTVRPCHLTDRGVEGWRVNVPNLLRA